VNVLTNTKECRRAYREIIQGYSYLEDDNLYVKHFAESDLGYIEILYKTCEKELESMGIDTLKKKLAFLKKEEYWTQDEENTYINAKYAVSDGYAFIETVPDLKQKEQWMKVIHEKEEILKKVEDTRRELVNPTIEGFCDRKINEHYVRLALFKDHDLEKPAFSEEEFKEISYLELGDLVQKYNEAINVFDEENLKRIAVNGFFLNAFLMSENDPVKFYGKSVLQLTTYQMNLYGKGKFYKSILEEGKNPPDSFYDSIEERGLDPLVSWFDGAYAQIKSERNRREMKAKGRNR